MAKNSVSRKTATARKTAVATSVEMGLPQKLLKALRSGKKFTWAQLSAIAGEDIYPNRSKILSDLVAEGARLQSVKEGTITVAIRLINHDQFDVKGKLFRKPGRQPKGPFYHEVVRRPSLLLM